MKTDELSAFTKGYIECLLWSECTVDNGLEDMDISDLSDETLKAIEEDCKSFEGDNAEIWRAEGRWTDEQAGHDFLLTRNRHGAGFWDRGHGPVGRALTESAHPYGTFGLYLGDDGKLYHHN